MGKINGLMYVKAKSHFLSEAASCIGCYKSEKLFCDQQLIHLLSSIRTDDDDQVVTLRQIADG